MGCPGGWLCSFQLRNILQYLSKALPWPLALSSGHCGEEREPPAACTNASNVSEGEALPGKKGKLLALNGERETLDLPLKPLSSHHHAGEDVGNG